MTMLDWAKKEVEIACERGREMVEIPGIRVCDSEDAGKWLEADDGVKGEKDGKK